jgi:hypothetical protein
MFAAWCAVYRETALTPGTLSGEIRLDPIVDGAGTPYRLPVYNAFCHPVPGDEFVPTSLLKSGRRYVLDWDNCDSSDSSDSSSDSSDSSDSSSDSSDSNDSSSDSSDSSDSSSDSVSIDSSSADLTGTCIEVPTCTWWGRLFEGGGYAWLAYSDLTMPQCRGLLTFPSIGCDCAEPARAPAYEYEIVYTPCNTAD